MSSREPIFLITDTAANPYAAIAVENGRWVGRDTNGRQLFSRQDHAGASHAARTPATLTCTTWFGIRAPRPGQTRSQPILRDRRGLPCITEPWPMYVTECCAATVTITIDDAVPCFRACYTAVDPRLGWDPDIDTSQPH
jgi:hypothetical protein